MTLLPRSKQSYAAGFTLRLALRKLTAEAAASTFRYNRLRLRTTLADYV
ncbi:hypothetical protein [Komarekiella delphini-convector]|nr:hypothetical protein [Komarekiella delphini-convector]